MSGYFCDQTSSESGAAIPLTDKGSKILAAMTKTYGAKKGESVFYASRNKWRISGVEKARAKKASKK